MNAHHHSESAPVATQFYLSNDPLPLRCGESLPGFQLAYETYGERNAAGDNAILVFHAMTGSHHAAGYNPDVQGTDGRWTAEMHEGWWEGFIGPGKALDTSKFFVVCANYLGGCYGSTGPASMDPITGKPFGPRFPVLRVADIVDAQVRLLDHLGIAQLHACIGASIGGYLSQSLATRYPRRVRNVIPIGTGPATTVLQRILNFEQITAIEGDPAFRGGDYYGGKPPRLGLALARRIAHKTFISLTALTERATDQVLSAAPPLCWYAMNHPVESYMLHQGDKFVERFDANSYLRILDAWQWFDLAAEAGAASLEEAFARCSGQRFLVFSIDSDLSFYPDEQARLVRLLKGAGVDSTWITVHSDKGHDSFLLEPRLYAPYISHFLCETRPDL